MPRNVTAAGRPARPIKRICSVRGAVGARGCPRGAGCRKARQANFGSVWGVAGCGVSHGVRGAAGVKNVETHAVRRPVKGGPARMPQT